MSPTNRTRDIEISSPATRHYAAVPLLFPPGLSQEILRTRVRLRFLKIHSFPHSTVNIEEIFQKYFIEILQYCKNIYKAGRNVSEILQEPCKDRSKQYKWNVAAIFIFHCHIAVMWGLSSLILRFFKLIIPKKEVFTSKYPLKKYGQYFIINNIRKKRLLRNFIFSIYFLLSLGFEPTHLQTSYLILTRTLTITLLNTYRFVVF